MKLFYDVDRLRIAGKAWQVRAKLRELAAHRITLKDFLHQQQADS